MRGLPLILKKLSFCRGGRGYAVIFGKIGLNAEELRGFNDGDASRESFFFAEDSAIRTESFFNGERLGVFN